jgi:hypothetical protein
VSSYSVSSAGLPALWPVLLAAGLPVLVDGMVA